MNETGRILAIDYGARRVGIAVSDPLKLTAQSLPTIQAIGLQKVLSELEAIIADKNVAEIVVGMPLNLKGEKTAAAQKVEKFIHKLQNRFKLPVHSWDERWTSIAAQRTIWEFGKSPSQHKEKVDQISAMLILQSFLDHLSFKNQPAKQDFEE
jgi:putative Holliday junction resolvase